jgi:putative transposase
LSLSAYIHKNAADIEGYADKIENYKYSSLGIYVGLREESIPLVNYGFVLQFFSKHINKSKKKYLQFIYQFNEEKLKTDLEFENEDTEYRSEERILIHDFSAGEVVNFVASYTMKSEAAIHTRFIEELTEFKALTILLLRGICGMKEKEICSLIGNIGQSQVAKLCSMGLRLVIGKESYKMIISDFIESHTIR